MKFMTFHEAYPSMLGLLLKDPTYHNSPRGFSSGERIGVQYVLQEANQRVPFVPARRLNIVFNFAESLWYLSGRDDLAFIAYYAPNMRRYSADGERLTGTAYGTSIFGTNGGPNQWQEVLGQLTTDPDSKRAVIQIFAGNELAVPDNPDVSCTLGLQFMIRDDALHAVGFMRANDVYRGMVSDVFSFTFLQEMMATQLGLTTGNYVHMVGSLHLYESDAHRAQEVVADPLADEPSTLRFPPMPIGDNWPFVREVLEIEESLRNNRHRIGSNVDALALPEYWTQVLLLLEAYRRVQHDSSEPTLADDELAARLQPAYRWLLAHRWSRFGSPHLPASS